MMNKTKTLFKHTVAKLIAVCFIVATVIGTVHPVNVYAEEVNVAKLVDKSRINPKTHAPILNIDQTFKEKFLGFNGHEIQRKNVKPKHFYIMQGIGHRGKGTSPPSFNLEVVKVLKVERKGFLWWDYYNITYLNYNEDGSRAEDIRLMSRGNFLRTDRFFEITLDMFDRW